MFSVTFDERIGTSTRPSHVKPEALEFCKKPTTACMESHLFVGKYTLSSNTMLDNLT